MVRFAMICAVLFFGASTTAQFPLPAELPSRGGLPDPLVMHDGTEVATPDAWRSQRRPQLQALFEHYMYGRLPASPDAVTARTLFEDATAFGGKGTLREIELTFGPPDCPRIYLLLATPNASERVACFVGMNFGGNHLRSDDARIRLPTAWMPDRYPGVVDNRATDAGRGQGVDGGDVWPLEEAVRRGYAIATFYCGDIQPDRPGVREGMRVVQLAADETSREASARGADGGETATIMWWAWGIHRAVDYLVTDPAIDAERIGVVGHSRLGKTALLAGALDERIALVIANQAGCGGSGPSRHDDPDAETVAIITKSFPHWFCRNFTELAADPSKLPFDQHCLVALCAPRPVLVDAAAEDKWANPPGQFEMLRAATPVYRLLGVEGLEATALPQAGAPLIESRLGYWLRPGEHAMGLADWQTFFAYADKWLPAP
jgi:hypothetical protein